MSKSNKKLIITLTNPTGKYLDMTPEEITKQDNDMSKIKIIEQNKQQEKQNAETKKASGKQKLKDLGLTDAEIKALTGA
jgi:hypothetical protein